MKYSFVFGKLGRDSASSQDNDAAAAAAGAPGAVSTAETADMHADFVCTERFADNFWSEDGRCVSVLTTKLKNAKQSCLDLLTMVSKRAEIEEELGKKMLKLKVGTIKDAFRCVRVEMENTAKTHLDLAKQLRTELEKPFLGFMDDQKRKRRAQTSEERSQLRGMIRKLQDKRRSDTRKVGDLELQVNGLHGMGDPKLRNKLERAQAQQRATEKEYVDVRQRLHDADQQWYHVWRSACDVFQVLEEQRISYLKHIDLERIDVASDISAFIRTFGTGGPDPELDPEGARASADRMSQDAGSGNSRSQSTVLGTVSSAVPTPESTRPIHRTPTSNSQDSVPTESHGGAMAGSVSQQPLGMDPRQQHGPPLPVRNSSRPVSMHAQGMQALAGASAAEAAWNDRPRSSMQQGSSFNGAAAHYRRSSNADVYNTLSSSSQQQQQPSPQQRRNQAPASRPADTLYSGTVNGISAGIPAPMATQRPSTPGQMGDISGSYSAGQQPAPTHRLTAIACKHIQWHDDCSNRAIWRAHCQYTDTDSSATAAAAAAAGSICDPVPAEWRAKLVCQGRARFLSCRIRSTSRHSLSQRTWCHARLRKCRIRPISNISHTSSTNGRPSQQQQQQQPAHGEPNFTKDQREIISYVKGNLTIREGDIISVLQVNPDGWRGVFPSNFVDPISNLTAS
ncbi:hypothetical protein DL89DRAFT_265481 [Linderina pennispora]|uniref:FCH domain-containing protein n=1 Tax=Linderina pennispora TaxID=61395 RepID=A0A1Y1WEU8_9FUNG|nr:uncharacterized protein DL89DRAFT_265481 [Linderina pennispora]ORX71766.1 hypothetical protein DL89DRAFT_265481 [Linderina pennispora]